MGLSTEPSVVLPMGVPMGLSPVPWNSHLVLYLLASKMHSPGILTAQIPDRQ